MLVQLLFIPLATHRPKQARLRIGKSLVQIVNSHKGGHLLPFRHIQAISIEMVVIMYEYYLLIILLFLHSSGCLHPAQLVSLWMPHHPRGAHEYVVS